MPPALEWKIMSTQILLREGFYSLEHNLPLFFLTTTCLCTHEQAIPIWSIFLIQITKNTRQRAIKIRATLYFTQHHKYGFGIKKKNKKKNREQRVMDK